MKRAASVAAVVGGVLAVAPFVWMVLASVSRQEDLLAFPPRVLSVGPQWSNYAEIGKYLPVGTLAANSAFVAAGITAIEVSVGAIAAFAFARLRFPARETIFRLFVVTLLLPGQVTIIPNFVLLRLFGWLDSYVGLIVPPAFAAFAVFYLRQQFLSMPTDIESAARADGCGWFGVLARITVPIHAPAIATIAVLTFIAQWNAFLWPLIVARSESLWTITIGLRHLVDIVGTRYEILMAATSIAALPPIALYLIARRFIGTDVTSSALR